MIKLFEINVDPRFYEAVCTLAGIQSSVKTKTPTSEPDSKVNGAKSPLPTRNELEGRPEPEPKAEEVSSDELRAECRQLAGVLVQSDRERLKDCLKLVGAASVSKCPEKKLSALRDLLV